MVKDAEENAAKDKERAEQIEIKNQADSLTYQTKKQIEELGDKLEQSESETITKLLDNLESASKAENYEEMKRLTEEVKTEMSKVGQKIYSQGPETSNVPPDDVIETDFSSEKD